MNSKVSIVFFVLVAVFALSGKVHGDHGCHKGYCWSNCEGVVSGNEWCYTTKGYTQDKQYVKCSSNGECKADWRCGGFCTY